MDKRPFDLEAFLVASAGPFRDSGVRYIPTGLRQIELFVFELTMQCDDEGSEPYVLTVLWTPGRGGGTIHLSCSFDIEQEGSHPIANIVEMIVGRNHHARVSHVDPLEEDDSWTVICHVGIMILEDTPMEMLMASFQLYLSQFLDEVTEDYQALNRGLEVLESEEAALTPN